jgi:glycosyltransferase involved in cell wall biosynthesis
VGNAPLRHHETVRLLLDYRPALREPTGVGEWVHQLATALLELDDGPLELTVFASSWKDRLHAPPPGARPVDRRVPVRLLNWLWHRLEWPPVEQLAGGPFDAVVSPHPLLVPTRSAAQLVTVHDLDFLDHPERARAEIRRDYPTLAPQHARRADMVLVPSRATARQVADRFGVPAERIALVPNGAPEWAPRRAAPGDGYILFVGTLAPRKNIGGLLAAYRRLVARGGRVPDLVLAGRADPAVEDWLAAAREPPLAGRVRRLGYVPRDRRRALYEGAALLVLPSFDEGFGLPVVEAMTVGVPVVASNRGALPEVVGEAGLLIDPDDPAALAEAMARLLADAALARRLVERGFDEVRRFSWTASARALREACRRAMAIRRSRS